MKGHSRGFSLVELMLALAVVSIGILVMLQQTTLNHREMGYSKDRAFAYQTAMSLLSELQNAIERGTLTDGAELDLMEDSGGHNPLLTTLLDGAGKPFSPDHRMSGNQKSAGQWLWSRSISVEQPANQDRLRYVRIKMYRWAGKWTLQATVGATLALPTRGEPSVQTYDVYVLALAAAPSLWMDLNAVRALVQQTCTNLENQDPSTRYRLHWITRLGYGRDPLYTPYVNSKVAAAEAAPLAYWYPKLLSGPNAGQTLFQSEFFSGRIQSESGVFNAYHASNNPHPHSVADQFNHCQRTPEARRTFVARLSGGQEQEEEPPLDLLLDRMYRQPDRYRNAVLLNLHGSAIVMPPLRNFSDAAKDPVKHPGVRVVTHPARLRTPRDPDGDGAHGDSVDPEFRVYAYKVDPAAGPVVLGEAITVQIMGLDLSKAVNAGANPSLLVHRLRGGINLTTGAVDAGSAAYSSFDSSNGSAPNKPSQAYEMHFQVGYSALPEPHTWIRLFNTPLTSPSVGEGGLPVTQRLYGMEYVPSPVVAGGFGQELDFAHSNRPKNTARWRIRIPVAALRSEVKAEADQRLTVVTRIGADLTTGLVGATVHQPHNRSETYTWWASSPEAVPITERFQMQGDPRHNPYQDLCRGGSSFPNGYNWNFDDLRNASQDVTIDWPCLDASRLQAGFGAGTIVDAPRMMQVLRHTLQQVGGVFVQAGAPTADTLLTGAEIALPSGDSNWPSRPVQLHGAFVGQSGTRFVDTVVPATSASGVLAGAQVVVGKGLAAGFQNRSWLGELFPDSGSSAWLATGNLPTSGAAYFHRLARVDVGNVQAPGTSFDFYSGSKLGPGGAVAFLNTGTLKATFLHDSPFTKTPPAAPGGSAPVVPESVKEEAEDVVEDLLAKESTAKATAEKSGTDLGSRFAMRMQSMAMVAAAEEPPAPVMAMEPAPAPTPTREESQPALALVPFRLDHTFAGVLPYFGKPEFPRSATEIDHVFLPAESKAAVTGMVTAVENGSASYYLLVGAAPTTPEQNDLIASSAIYYIKQVIEKAGERATQRVVQLPRLAILEPKSEASLNNPSGILIRWKTEFVDEVDADVDLVYSVIYSGDGGTSWRSIHDHTTVVPGTRPTGASLIADATKGIESLVVATPADKVPDGSYLIRVQGFHKKRLQHFSYHQVLLTIRR